MWKGAQVGLELSSMLNLSCQQRGRLVQPLQPLQANSLDPNPDELATTQTPPPAFYTLHPKHRMVNAGARLQDEAEGLQSDAQLRSQPHSQEEPG